MKLRIDTTRKTSRSNYKNDREIVQGDRTIMLGLLAIAILAINIMAVPVYGMFEDQYMICNNHYVCQITNIDDYNQTTIEHNFKYNLDTFDLVD